MRYIVLVFLGACSYGVLSTFVKLAYDAGFDENEVVGSQMLFGLVMMGLLSAGLRKENRDQGEQKKVRLTGKEWAGLLAVGSTTGLTGIFYYNALQNIPASIAVVLLFQFIWMGILIDALLERRMPGREQTAALVLTLAGTFLAGGMTGTGFQQLTFSGIVMGLLAALSYAIFIIFSGRIAVHVPSVRRSFIMQVGATVLALLVYPPAFLFDGALLHGLFLWGFLLALFGAVIPTLFFTIGVPHIGGSLASILSAAELPTAVFMSSLVLHESVYWGQWLGVALILCGIALPEILRVKKRTKARSK